MSVQEYGAMPPEPPEWGDGPSSYEPGQAPRGPIDRTPPQDNAAEQSVLGSCLLSKDAIADVSEHLRGADFYRPAHETIYDAIIDLFGRGEPADPITVSAELQRRGELERIGGAPYLHTLSANVPIAANASYYAEIVREKAVLRRLVSAGTKIVGLGYSGEGEIDALVDEAQAEVYKVTDKRASEDYAPLSDIMEGVLDEIEALGSREAGVYGVPTGFADLDDLTNGLHAGQMIIVAARPAMGKALALDTPLPTPTGWTTMGEVQVGDLLYDAQGRHTRVVAATEVMHGRPCYEVRFSDGSTIVADEQHQWLTETRAARKSKWAAEKHYNRARNQNIFPAVVTTAEIAGTLRVGADARANHAVVNAEPLEGTWSRDGMPVAAYVLGAWLGDGHTAGARITCETDEIPMYIEGYGYDAIPRGDMLYSIKVPLPLTDEHGHRTCGFCGGEFGPACRADHGTFTALLRKAGVLGDKHIPAAYLRAAEPIRRELLAGLMDTDGTVVKGVGSCQFAVTNKRLADDVYELVVSLGYKCGRTTKRVNGRSEETSTCYILNFSTTDDVFRLYRKQTAHKLERPQTTVRIGRRYVTDVRRIESVPVRCVQVDNEDHLYLAGRSMIPTHNSTLALDFCRAASIHNNLASVFFSLEMNRSEITMRLLSAEAKVPLNHIRTGQMTDDDWAKLARKMGEVSSAPMFIDDSPNMTMMEIRAKARRLKQNHDLKLIVIDYMQLMTSGKKVESRQLEVSEFSRNIKLLAKELEVPVVALSQLNRGSEQRADKRPMVSDLRESGCLTADTRLMRADTNAEITLGELLESEARDVPVWALGDRLKLVPRTLTHAFPSGTKEVFEVTLASGRRVQATANHPFLTYDGWMPLGELTTGSRVGSIRHVPPPLEIVERDNYEVVLLAHLIGDGSFVRRQPIRYASKDPLCLDTVQVAARKLFGIEGVRDEYPAARCTTLRLPAPYHLTHGKRNPIAAWLDEMGLFGLRSHEKFIPDWVFQLPKEQAALFLRNLWATDGSVRWDDVAQMGRIYYASTSRQLADDVVRLLLRFNIYAKLRVAPKEGYRDSFHVVIEAAENQIRFLEEIGVTGARHTRAEEVLERLHTIQSRAGGDTVPVHVWDRVRDLLVDAPMDVKELCVAVGAPATMMARAPGRNRLRRVAAVLAAEDLDVLATNDVRWDEIKSVRSLGEQPVYDATVLGLHNFIANCIPMHNSLEQDADMVILLHRDDVYEKESTRPGEADMIVAKHRNGPTRDIVVAFQGHYSRFVDMAH